MTAIRQAIGQGELLLLADLRRFDCPIAVDRCSAARLTAVDPLQTITIVFFGTSD
jgi:hypothetical protein